MNPFPVKSRLLPLLRRQRAARLWKTLALCWLIGCLVGLGFLWLATSSGWLPPALLPCLLIVGGTVAAVVWFRDRRTEPDWRGCARAIESRRPELNGRLLTAVEQQPDEQGRFSYLQGRLFDEVLAHDRMFDWDGFFPASRLSFVKVAHAVAFAAFLGTCLKLGMVRTEHPDGVSVAGGVVVTPGDTSLERGSSLVVMVQFGNRVPTGVDLSVRQEGQSSRRIPLVRSLEDPVFGGSVPNVTGDLQYVVEYAGHHSRPFKVTVFDYPGLERADADLNYPDYTGLPPKHIENTRRLTAVEGTRVDLALQLNKPVERAELLPGTTGSAPVALAADPNQPKAQLTNFLLSDSERYALQLVDAEGRTNKHAIPFVFNVLSNQVPVIKIVAPRGDTRPSALQEITFQGSVFDDFGVSAYGLAYVVGGQKIHTVELGRGVPGREKRPFEHVLSLEDLGVQPGDLVSWFLWAEDTGPDGRTRQTMSDLYFAEIRPFEEIFRQGQSQFGQMNQQQQAGGGGGRTAQLLELQQQIIHATWKLQRQHANSSLPASATPRSSSLTPPMDTFGDGRFDHGDSGKASMPAGSRLATISRSSLLWDCDERQGATPLSNQGSASKAVSPLRSATALQILQIGCCMPEGAGTDSRTTRLPLGTLNRTDLPAARQRLGLRRQSATTTALFEGLGDPRSCSKPRNGFSTAFENENEGRARGRVGVGSGDASMRHQLNGFLAGMIDSVGWTMSGRSQFLGQRAGTGQRDSSAGQRPLSPGPASSTAGVTRDLREDLQVVMDAQEDAIRQAREARQAQQDPRQIALWDEAIEKMESALERLGKATNSPAAFQEALSAQQAAYQQLLRLQEREYSVSRNQNRGGMPGGRQRQMQRQLDQLDLTPEENRYETERLAQAPQSAEQREQLQVMSRLAELARRQQDINERLQELQVALQAAQSEEARERLQRELKRLQEEQQQMLANLDELRQRLDSQENQSRFSNQREELDQTRESIQRAAEAAGQGDVSDALAAGTRAQRQMEQMREDLRNQSAGAFANDMRQLRSDARELARQQTEVQDQIEELDHGTQKSLSDSDQTAQARERLRRQRERLTNLVDRASQVSQLAEQAEPAMSSELYDTVREFSQDDLGAVKQMQEDLLANGRFPLYQRLKQIADDSEAKTLDTTSTLLDEGYPELARQTGQRALQDINDLARGIERAAALVVGDDTEALRRAQQQLQQLTDQLEQEADRATGPGTNAQASAAANGNGAETSQRQPGQTGSREGQSAGNGQQANANEPGNNPGALNQQGGGALAQGSGSQQPSDQSDQNPNGNPGANGQGSPTEAVRPSTANESSNPSNFDLNQFWGGGRSGGAVRTGPITGDGFGPWSDRLREVEEMVELPDLRNEVTRARERARELRRDYTRNAQKPDWAQVRLQIVQPLVEVQKAIGEELARRASRENLVPIDRDPVPDRYSDLVKRYYEELGKDHD